MAASEATSHSSASGTRERFAKRRAFGSRSSLRDAARDGVRTDARRRRVEPKFRTEEPNNQEFVLTGVETTMVCGRSSYSSPPGCPPCTLTPATGPVPRRGSGFIDTTLNPCSAGRGVETTVGGPRTGNHGSHSPGQQVSAFAGYNWSQIPAGARHSQPRECGAAVCSPS